MLVSEPTSANSSPSAGKQNQTPQEIEKAQEAIYEFLLNLVKQCPPELVLTEFKNLFIHSANTVSSDINQALYRIIFSNNEQEFFNTLKRSCYILINNWNNPKHQPFIQRLVQLLAELPAQKRTLSLILKRLGGWLEHFVNSDDYQELKLFAAAFDHSKEKHWSQRYTSYLLVSQSANATNSAEQRETAKQVAKQLKDKFKRDLAMYIARSQCALPRENPSKNPTLLGDDVLVLIKRILARKSLFSYANLANIFLNQTYDMNYKYFKRSLRRYLVYSMSNQELAESIKTSLCKHLESLYEIHHEKRVDDALLLRTCNRVIECLTTENQKEPSQLFTLLVLQKNPLTLVILLLKIILICKNSRTHLECCIANLVKYYEELSEEECPWIINFLEIFNIIFTVYAEDVQYNLISPEVSLHSNPKGLTLESCQIFSQHRCESLRQAIAPSFS